LDISERYTDCLLLNSCMTNPFTRVPSVFPDAFEIEQVQAHITNAFSRLLARIDFLEALSMREQVHIACEERRGLDNLRVPLEVIAGFLGLSCHALFNQLHPPIETNARGRPKCLAPEAYEMISMTIANHFERWPRVSYNFLLDPILYFFGIGMRSDTLRHLSRCLPGGKTIPGVPMEAHGIKPQFLTSLSLRSLQWDPSHLWVEMASSIGALIASG
jgi:hypothetical protein